MAFSDDILIFLMSNVLVPIIIAVGAFVWILFRISSMNTYLKEIRDLLKERNGEEVPKPPES